MLVLDGSSTPRRRGLRLAHYLVEILTNLPKAGYNYATEFEWGLDLMLDSLERMRRERDLTGAAQTANEAASAA